MGFLLLGFLNPTNEGFSNIYIYLICYMISNLGVIGVLMQIKANGNFIEKIDDLSGLHNKQPFLSFLLATFLFSMAGIPPMGGFFGKINIFLSLLSKGYIYLAIFAGLLSVVGVYYYLRIIKNIYVNDSQIAFSVKNKSFSLTNIILVFCFMIIFFFMFIIDKINLAITKIGVF
jgi:NADH-quinone oxidoreductase subunit N